MILRILLLTCAVFISQTYGKMDMVKFTRNFEDRCFMNEETDPFRVNGQDAPLSNTLENFIAIAEKFEAANPSITLRDELAFFISEYVFENIKIVGGSVDLWRVGKANFEKIDPMWDPDANGYRPTFNIPFSEAENCSLYYMISHSILSKDTALYSSRNYAPGNFSSYPARTQDLNPDEYFPQEIGVVSIRGTDAAVSLSKVLIGLFVGLKPDRKTDLTSYDNVQGLDIPPEQLPQDKTVDALYIVTMADVLMSSQWPVSGRKGLAANGKWVSIPITAEKKIDGFCPMVYLQQVKNGVLPAYSYSSVRGAADGLILGLAASNVNIKKEKAKLSQILRMYYSPDGISFESQVEDINSNHISFCNRKSLVEVLEFKLQDQMKSYGYLIAQAAKDVEPGYAKARSLYSSEKNTIFDNSNSELRDYCDRPTSLEKPEDLPKETLLDVIVVMDSSSGENFFQDQQVIVGYLAKHLDLRYSGSQMTILLDQKISSGSGSGSGSSSKIELKPVVYNTYSSSCAACTVAQIDYEASNVDRDEIIEGISQFLEERKENETKLYGVNGKIVLYFNFENNDGRRNNKIQGNLEKALRDLHLLHQDIEFYAIGLDPEQLKKYAKNDPSLVFLASDGTLEDVAKKIYHRINFSPALLQYDECKDEKTDRIVTFDGLVSPHIIQHYKMPAEYFYKSSKATFKFESQTGNVRVCYNRATARPENEIKNCKDTSSNNAAEFKVTNPCKDFYKENCSPLYFSVMGLNGNEGEMKTDTRPRSYCDDLNADKWCANLDQIKFKVSHTGVRCSGCLGLGAPPTVILLTLLLTYFLHKRI